MAGVVYPRWKYLHLISHWALVLQNEGRRPSRAWPLITDTSNLSGLVQSSLSISQCFRGTDCTQKNGNPEERNTVVLYFVEWCVCVCAFFVVVRGRPAISQGLWEKLIGCTKLNYLLLISEATFNSSPVFPPLFSCALFWGPVQSVSSDVHVGNCHSQVFQPL